MADRIKARLKGRYVGDCVCIYMIIIVIYMIIIIIYMIIIVIYETEDRPSPKDFNNHVRKQVASIWDDLGIQLDIDLSKLDQIQADHQDNLKRCTEMFKHWCQKYPIEATWESLIEALKSPSIELNDLAESIKQKLLPGEN